MCCPISLAKKVIEPWFYNPHSGDLIHSIFDPPHGVKTKRNVVHGSGQTGTRWLSMSVKLLSRYLDRFLLARGKMPLQRTFTGTSDSLDYLNKPKTKITAVPPSTPVSTDAAPLPKTGKQNKPRKPVEPAPGRVYFGFDQLLQIWVELSKKEKAGIAPEAFEITKETVLLNNWSKMRVYLAKAWFSHRTTSYLEVRSESEDYCDASQVALLLYLDAMQAIYIDFLMNPVALQSVEAGPVTSLCWGVEFLLDWMADMSEFPDGTTPAAKERHFMADLTLVQILVTCIGIQHFLRYRLNKYPGSWVVMRRISQSGLESVFGLLRSYVNGDITSLSFRRAYAMVDYLWDGQVYTRELFYLDGPLASRQQ
jgi:hypothetical protein